MWMLELGIDNFYQLHGWENGRMGEWENYSMIKFVRNDQNCGCGSFHGISIYKSQIN